MSQYAKADAMENRRLQLVLGPIFEFRSAEADALLEATLELCRKTRIYNEIFLQINEECEQSTNHVEQIFDPEPTSAPAARMKPLTFVQQTLSTLESPAMTVSALDRVLNCKATTPAVESYDAFDSSTSSTAGHPNFRDF